MTNPAEQDPTARIVDIDTFNLWLIGYRSHLIETAPVIIIPWENSLPDDEKDEDYDPVSYLSLEACQWSAIPDSIQEIVKKQYDCASLDSPKTVNIHIRATGLFFELNSSDVQDGIDTYGEHTVPLRGFHLQLTDDLHESAEKGQWDITKESLKDHQAVMRKFDEFREGKLLSAADILAIGETASRGKHYINASLRQLHDVARLLNGQRGNAKVYKIDPQ